MCVHVLVFRSQTSGFHWPGSCLAAAVLEPRNYVGRINPILFWAELHGLAANGEHPRLGRPSEPRFFAGPASHTAAIFECQVGFMCFNLHKYRHGLPYVTFGTACLRVLGRGRLTAVSGPFALAFVQCIVYVFPTDGTRQCEESLHVRVTVLRETD